MGQSTYSTFFVKIEHEVLTKKQTKAKKQIPNSDNVGSNDF